MAAGLLLSSEFISAQPRGWGCRKGSSGSVVKDRQENRELVQRDESQGTVCAGVVGAQRLRKAPCGRRILCWALSAAGMGLACREVKKRGRAEGTACARTGGQRGARGLREPATGAQPSLQGVSVSVSREQKGMSSARTWQSVILPRRLDFIPKTVGSLWQILGGREA